MGTCLLLAGAPAMAATVADHLDDGCSTAVVDGLSRQIVDAVNCLAPGALVPLPESADIAFEIDHILPYLDLEAKEDLEAAARAGGGTMHVNSLYRTVAQQVLLRRWWEDGRCGIGAAALPGTSNHESGRAIDLTDWEDWVDVLSDHGWAHDVPGDEVHFDHLDSPDLAGMDVHAFQRLWNRNHPEDLLEEDGEFGPDTEDRLLGAPADGFAAGACGDGDGQGEDGTRLPLPFPGKGDGAPLDEGGGCAVGRGPAGGSLFLLLILCAVLRFGPGACSVSCSRRRTRHEQAYASRTGSLPRPDGGMHRSR